MDSLVCSLTIVAKGIFLATLKQIGRGFIVSLIIFVLTVILSLPLGLIVARIRMSKSRILRSLISVYISIMRGTPLMLQLLIVYFLPYYAFNISLRSLEIGSISFRMIATIIAFTLNYAAYFAEIFRGGMLSIAQGQYEAAELMGFSKTQINLRIIYPQMFRNVLPAITNEIITLVKDTSLSQVLSTGEMFFMASSLSSAQVSMVPFIVAGVFYYFSNVIIECLMHALERKMRCYL